MADYCGCQLLILEHVFKALQRDTRLRRQRMKAVYMLPLKDTSAITDLPHQLHSHNSAETTVFTFEVAVRCGIHY